MLIISHFLEIEKMFRWAVNVAVWDFICIFDNMWYNIIIVGSVIGGVSCTLFYQEKNLAMPDRGSFLIKLGR